MKIDIAIATYNNLVREANSLDKQAMEMKLNADHYRNVAVKISNGFDRLEWNKLISPTMTEGTIAVKPTNSGT